MYNKPNPILNTDGYKLSHWLQYPPKTEFVYSYIESRGYSKNQTPKENPKGTIFFGLQDFILSQLRPVLTGDVLEAMKFFKNYGVPWNQEGWVNLIRKHNGVFPLHIKAVPEGTFVPLNNVLVTVENTDPEFFWLTSYIEQALLRAIWYPTTVATNSFTIKQDLLKMHEQTSDSSVEDIDFQLHDFGGRGVSSFESSQIGGIAHLLSFKGTDTVPTLQRAYLSYDADLTKLGFSIPAAEHSTITSWGRNNEEQAYENMLKQFAKPGSMVAVVSDSYDIEKAVRDFWGDSLKEEVINSGATVIVRPDSGDPTSTVIKVLDILMKKYGFAINSKGYRVLPDCIRVIQGDGVNRISINSILTAMKINHMALDNIAFGMGGALLQDVTRDDFEFAMKCSAIKVDGEWRDVYKDPATASSKISKKGRLSLIDQEGEIKTVDQEGAWKFNKQDLLKTVWKNGKHINKQSFENIRNKVNNYLTQ